MSPQTLLRLYPQKWRERYGDEFLALLQQTGVGWRQVTDVCTAASREWVKALVPWRSLEPLANEARRGLGYFSIAWCVTALGALVFMDDLKAYFWDDAVQAQMVLLFMASAMLCNPLERLAFRFVLRGRATPSEATAVNVGAFLIVSTAVVFGARAFAPGRVPWIDIPGAVTPFVMCGEFFGRPPLGKRSAVRDVGLSV